MGACGSCTQVLRAKDWRAEADGYGNGRGWRCRCTAWCRMGFVSTYDENVVRSGLEVRSFRKHFVEAQQVLFGASGHSLGSLPALQMLVR